MDALPLGKIFISLKNGSRINLFARGEPDAVTLEKGFRGIAHPAIELLHRKAAAFGTGGQCICPGRRRSIPIRSSGFVDGFEHLSVRALPLIFLSGKALRRKGIQRQVMREDGRGTKAIRRILSKRQQPFAQLLRHYRRLLPLRRIGAFGVGNEEFAAGCQQQVQEDVAVVGSAVAVAAPRKALHQIKLLGVGGPREA